MQEYLSEDSRSYIILVVIVVNVKVKQLCNFELLYVLLRMYIYIYVRGLLVFKLSGQIHYA